MELPIDLAHINPVFFLLRVSSIKNGLQQPPFVIKRHVHKPWIIIINIINRSFYQGRFSFYQLCCRHVFDLRDCPFYLLPFDMLEIIPLRMPNIRLDLSLLQINSLISVSLRATTRHISGYQRPCPPKIGLLPNLLSFSEEF